MNLYVKRNGIILSANVDSCFKVREYHNMTQVKDLWALQTETA